jgi:hypothetical protein
MMFNPDPKSRAASSITAKFLMRSSRSTTSYLWCFEKNAVENFYRANEPF